MKFAPLFVRSGSVARLVGILLIALVALPGCGRHTRPASTLSEKDRTILEKYETIRAALVVDDLRTAKRAAIDLGKFLKPTPDAPATPYDAPVQDLATASTLDKARTAFGTLSADVIPLVDGVQGYYVMDSPVPTGAEWVQSTEKVDNPYVGKPMRDVGSLRP